MIKNERKFVHKFALDVEMDYYYRIKKFFKRN